MTLDALKRLLLPVTLVVAGASLVAGCSEDENEEETHYEEAPDCKAIADVCHGGSDEFAEECHEMGHANDAAECAQRKDECIDYCTSHTGEGGASGAGH